MQAFVDPAIWTACPLCNSVILNDLGVICGPGKTLFATQEIQVGFSRNLIRCGQCKSCFSNRTLSNESANLLYQCSETEIRWGSQPFREKHRPEVVAAINSTCDRPKSVLDVGCNTGSLLDHFATFGCRTEGIEPSLSGRAIAEKMGHTIYPDWSSVTSSYDIISAFDVIEHLYKPSEFLGWARNHLNPGGCLIIMTGDPQSAMASKFLGRWWYFQPIEHIVFPSNTWFSSVTGWTVSKRIETYAGKKYYPNLIRRMMICAGLYPRPYIGKPALSPDHQLVILERSC